MMPQEETCCCGSRNNAVTSACHRKKTKQKNCQKHVRLALLSEEGDTGQGGPRKAAQRCRLLEADKQFAVRFVPSID